VVPVRVLAAGQGPCLGTSGGPLERTRDALRALIGGVRLRVGPDPERGLRVDGWLALVIGGEESAREAFSASRASPRSSGGALCNKRKAPIRYPRSGVIRLTSQKRGREVCRALRALAAEFALTPM
jgi:hypothetical protein